MRKFTLIELLVVISIISILMSILLPALSDAREKTISAVCLSNIRQSLVHASIYQDDHRGMHTMYESNNGWSGWTGSLYALNYFQAKDNSIFCPKSDLGQGMGQQQNGELSKMLMLVIQGAIGII